MSLNISALTLGRYLSVTVYYTSPSLHILLLEREPPPTAKPAPGPSRQPQLLAPCLAPTKRSANIGRMNEAAAPGGRESPGLESLVPRCVRTIRVAGPQSRAGPGTPVGRGCSLPGPSARPCAAGASRELALPGQCRRPHRPHSPWWRGRRCSCPASGEWRVRCTPGREPSAGAGAADR